MGISIQYFGPVHDEDEQYFCEYEEYPSTCEGDYWEATVNRHGQYINAGTVCDAHKAKLAADETAYEARQETK